MGFDLNTRLWKCCLFAAALVAGAGAPASAQAKIGFINSQKIIAEAPGAAEAQQAFKRDVSRYENDIKSLEQTLERTRAELARLPGGATNDAARQQREREFQQRVVAYQDSVQKIQRVVQQRQQQLVSPIMTRISEAIEAVRNEGQYAMIFDVSAGSVISADPALDLTNRVLERLRRSPR